MLCIGLFLIIKHNCNCMNFQKDYQYHFERMFQDSFMIQYLLQPLILFLIIILIYVFIKKKLLRDEKEDLESLKLLQEYLILEQLMTMNFKRKRTVLLQNGNTVRNQVKHLLLILSFLLLSSPVIGYF